jgi:diacylglycerol kinase (ATP)
MPEKRNALVVHSPHSGRAPQLKQALDHLQQAGFDLTHVVSIDTLTDLPPQGALWRQQGIELVIAAGGDGLVGGLVRHVLKDGPTLGILPLGTANDTARSLSIPQDLEGAVAVVSEGHEQEIDVGMAISSPAADATHLPADAAGERYDYFLHTLTVGLNVEFARLATSSALRERFGPITYPVAALEALRSHEALEVTLQFENLFLPPALAEAQGAEGPAIPSELRCPALEVAVVNAPIFGGPLQLAIPGASLTDGLLDIVIVHGIDWKEIAEALTRFFGHGDAKAVEAAEQQIHHPAELTVIPGLHHLRAAGVKISTDSDPSDATLDGEVRAQTPLQVRIAAERLRVLVPAGFKASPGSVS